MVNVERIKDSNIESQFYDEHEIRVSYSTTVECECGNDVTLHSIQRTVICQGCGAEWEVFAA